MLSPHNKRILINHLNMRLKSVRIMDCGFCQIAIDLLNEWERNNEPLDCDGELEDFCAHCPLQRSGHENRYDCEDCRQDNLIDHTDGRPTKQYQCATDSSIIAHVGYMMEKANKFWGIKLYWDHSSDNNIEIVDTKKEDKNADSRAG